LIARIIWPSARIDSISIWLLIIAAVIILAPELRRLLPYVSEARVGPVTVKIREIREDINKVIEDTNAVEETISQEPSLLIVEEADGEVDDIRSLLKTSVDPRQILVMLAIELEKTIGDRLKEAEIPEANRPLSFSRMVSVGQDAGVIPADIVPIVNQFWEVRNLVVHSVDVQIDNATLYSLIDAGLEVLGLLSMKLAKEISFQSEADLTQKDYEEFEAIADIVKTIDQYYPIPDGQAIRRNTKKNSTDMITAIYPIEHGNRYVQYRVDITGEKDRLVRKVISETVPSV
jgi:hypothetical protein